MPISADLRQLLLILEEEGFGAIAGEILTEVSLGREDEKVGPTYNEGQASYTVIARIPIDETEQLARAIEFLRLRLVMPARAFAEAERLAGAISKDERTRILFVDPSEGVATAALAYGSAGSENTAIKLDALLAKLPGMFVAPRTGEL